MEFNFSNNFYYFSDYDAFRPLALEQLFRDAFFLADFGIGTKEKRNIIFFDLARLAEAKVKWMEKYSLFLSLRGVPPEAGRRGNLLEHNLSC